MQPDKIEPCIITARQAKEEDKLPEWVITVGKVAFWLSAILFFDAFVYSVNLTFK